MKWYKKKKISKKTLAVLIIISITIPLLLVTLTSFSLFPTGQDTSVYISATDIIKNFKFTTFDGETIVNDGVYNNKLRFDKQAAWRLYKNDVTLVSKQEIGDSTILRYRLVVRNAINIYTNVKLSQMSSNIMKVPGKYLGVRYIHFNLGQRSYTTWSQYVTWEHYDFGDIKTYNTRNNIFSGRLKMTFDIDTNPIPDTFGTGTSTEYGYITISEAGVVTSSWGKMSTNMPTIVNLSPSEEESGFKDGFNDGTAGVEAVNLDIEPGTEITVWEGPAESFDGGVQPESVGDSLNPTNKDGSDIWDVEAEEKSMSGAELNYDLDKLSPIVYLWKGKLEYTSHDVKIEDVLGAWFVVVPVLRHHWETPMIEYGDVALHGINRYIQSEIYIAFDIWTEVKIGTLTDYYQNMKLEAPQEYYDTLIWSTLAGGWDGSIIKEYETPVGEWFKGIFDIFGGLEGFIITIVIAIGLIFGGYIFLKVGVPYIRIRQRRKEYSNRR